MSQSSRLRRKASRVAAPLVAAAVAVAALMPLTRPAAAERVVPGSIVATTLTAEEWRLFTSRFVSSDGRVVDIEKNGVSHSEGQAYGLVLAVRADDRATFDAILSFTVANMRRTDGLFSWIWDPRAYPRVTDTNNASDGDILIAYALVTAAVKWDEPRYVALAVPLIDVIGETLLDARDGHVRLRPGAFGFDDTHPDGPVVNLSYYAYGAFLLFDAIDDEHPWLEAWQSGLMLTEEAVAARGAVPDWATLRRGRRLAPAEGFAATSSYDAVRVPLYMALGGRVPARYFAPFDEAWNVAGRGAPKDVDLTGARLPNDMNEPGYRAIAAVAACAARGATLPDDVQRFRVQRYFAASLHLLALSAVRAHYPQCLEAPVAAGPAWSFSAHN